MTLQIRARTTTHALLAFFRSSARVLTLNPQQRGRLAVFLNAKELPPGAVLTTLAGQPLIEIDEAAMTDFFSQQIVKAVTPTDWRRIAEHLNPDDPPLFHLASNTVLFFPWTTPNTPYLLGAQPDTVKVLPPHLLASLGGIVAPASDFRGVLEPSFLVFKSLGGIVFAKRPVTFIATPDELARIRRIVALELFGPDEQTILRELTSLSGYYGPLAEDLRSELLYLAIRPGFGPWDGGKTQPLGLESYIRTVAFDDTSAPHLTRVGNFHFRVDEGDGPYDLAIQPRKPQPIISMPEQRLPHDPLGTIPDNSVFMVSTGNGMATGITVCFIIKVQGKTILVETSAYAKQYLAKLGINISTIDFVYISHHHRDHDNLDELVSAMTTRTSYIMTPLTLDCVTRKAADMAGHLTQQEVVEALNPLELYPGQPLIIGQGKQRVKLEVLSGIHSVSSSMLAVYTSDDKGKSWKKAVVYTGDTLGPKGLEQMVKSGIISAARRDEILEFVKDALVVVVDAGSNIIHPEPEEVITEWAPYITGILKLVHNVKADVVVGKIGKGDLSFLGEAANQAWSSLVRDGYIVEVMGKGLLLPKFDYRRRRDFSLSDASLQANEDGIFGVLARAGRLAKEAADKLGVSGEMVPLDTLASSISVISHVPFLRDLPPATIVALAKGSTITWQQRGKVLIETGSSSDGNFYIVRKGAVEVVTRSNEGLEETIILGPGQAFGERRVLLGTTANATVRTLSGVELQVLTAEQYEQLSPEEKATILTAVKKTEWMRPVIQQAFPHAPEEMVDALIMAAEPVEATMGTYLIREGDKRADRIFIIADGQVDVWQTKGQQKLLVATRVPGDIIGERSLLTGEPRNADCVVASEQVRAIAISKHVLEQLRRVYADLSLTLQQLVDLHQ